jgi:N-acylglucosamine-6-phosphate 2-epimerase
MRNGLIVACTAVGSEPCNSIEVQTLFAQAAVQGGAKGIRAEGAALVKAVRDSVSVPVIGWAASRHEDGTLKVTGTFAEITALLTAGSDLIAVDGTFRRRDGLTGPQFIERVKKEFDCPIIADVSTYAEGIACADYGTDAISTYLSGFTTETSYYPEERPDFNIIQTLVRELSIPVIADGKINIPKFAKDLLLDGAWAVVIETVITKPATVAGWFTTALQKAVDEKTESLDLNGDTR